MLIPRRADLLAFAIIAITGALVFFGALATGYTADDFDLLGQASSPEYRISDPIAAGTGRYFRPLVILSFRFEQRSAPENPAFLLHLSNLLLHVGSGLCVYWIGRSLTAKHRASLGLALVFLLHPAHVTNIYWISARFELLSTFLYLICLLGFIQYLRSGQPISLAISGASLAGSLLSKESGVTAPAVLLAILWLMLGWAPPGEAIPRDRTRCAAVVLSGFAGLTLLYAGSLYLHFYQGRTPAGIISLREAVKTLVATPLFLVYPNHSSEFVAIYHTHPWVIYPGATLAAAALFFIGWRVCRRGRRNLLLAGALAALPVIPAGLLALLGNGVSSRLVYLPIAMLCLAAAFLLRAIPALEPKLSLFAYLTLPVLAAASLHYGNVWVQNYQLTQRVCQEFRTFAADTPANQQIFVLNVPADAGGMHVFANDFNPAMNFCLNGGFGHLARLRWAGELTNENGLFEREIVAVDPGPAGEYQFHLTATGAYVWFFMRMQPGETIHIDPLEVKIDAVREDGTATGYSISFFEPDAPAQGTFLYFNGKDLERLGGQGGQDG